MLSDSNDVCEPRLALETAQKSLAPGIDFSYRAEGEDGVVGCLGSIKGGIELAVGEYEEMEACAESGSSGKMGLVRAWI